MERLVEHFSDGRLKMDFDLTAANKQWQHPWHLVHRVNLHGKLKELATAETGVGCPVKLHTASRVASVDPVEGILALESGTIVTADVVVGADGIYVRATIVFAMRPW